MGSVTVVPDRSDMERVRRAVEELAKVADPLAIEYLRSHRRKLIAQRAMALAIGNWMLQITKSYGSLEALASVSRKAWQDKLEDEPTVTKAFRRPKARDRELNEMLAMLLRRKSAVAVVSQETIERVEAEVMRVALNGTVTALEAHDPTLQKAAPVRRNFAPEVFDAEFDGLRAQVQQFLTKAAGNHAYDVANLLTNAADPRRPLSIPEAARQVREELPGLNRTRSEMIARTETARVYGATSLEVLAQNGVQRVRWLTAELSPAAQSTPVCPRCLANAAEGWVEVGRLFSSGHSHPPAHPYCRCDIIGDYENWEPPSRYWPDVPPQNVQDQASAEYKPALPKKAVIPKGSRVVDWKGGKVRVDTAGWVLNAKGLRDPRYKKPVAPPVAAPKPKKKPDEPKPVAKVGEAWRVGGYEADRSRVWVVREFKGKREGTYVDLHGWRLNAKGDRDPRYKKPIVEFKNPGSQFPLPKIKFAPPDFFPPPKPAPVGAPKPKAKPKAKPKPKRKPVKPATKKPVAGTGKKTHTGKTIYLEGVDPASGLRWITVQPGQFAPRIRVDHQGWAVNPKSHTRSKKYKSPLLDPIKVKTTPGVVGDTTLYPGMPANLPPARAALVNNIIDNTRARYLEVQQLKQEAKNTWKPLKDKEGHTMAHHDYKMRPLSGMKMFQVYEALSKLPSAYLREIRYIQPESMSGGKQGYVFSNLASGRGVIHMNPKAKWTARTLVHEATHVADQVYERTGGKQRMIPEATRDGLRQLFLDQQNLWLDASGHKHMPVTNTGSATWWFTIEAGIKKMPAKNRPTSTYSFAEVGEYIAEAVADFLMEPNKLRELNPKAHAIIAKHGLAVD